MSVIGSFIKLKVFPLCSIFAYHSTIEQFQSTDNTDKCIQFSLILAPIITGCNAAGGYQVKRLQIVSKITACSNPTESSMLNTIFRRKEGTLLLKVVLQRRDSEANQYNYLKKKKKVLLTCNIVFVTIYNIVIVILLLLPYNIVIILC